MVMTRSKLQITMSDILYLGLSAALFALGALYVCFCGKL